MWTGQRKDHTSLQSHEEQSQIPQLGNGVSGWQSACLACRAPGWLQSTTKNKRVTVPQCCHRKACWGDWAPPVYSGRESPAQCSEPYLEMLLGHSNGATLGVHRTLPGAVPVWIVLLPQVLVCRTLSLGQPHIKNHKKGREQFTAVKIQPHAGNHLCCLPPITSPPSWNPTL